MGQISVELTDIQLVRFDFSRRRHTKFFGAETRRCQKETLQWQFSLTFIVRKESGDEIWKAYRRNRIF